MSGGERLERKAKTAFAHVAGPVVANDNKPKSRPSPFCIRLSDEERAYLEDLAGNKPLGSYIRERLLANNVQKRRAIRRPKIEQEQYASLLAAMGESHLSNNINQLAKHANMGTLDVSDDVEQQLEDAYKAILAMREALFIALGLKTGAGK